jgi:hypothetical protein
MGYNAEYERRFGDIAVAVEARTPIDRRGLRLRWRTVARDMALSDVYILDDENGVSSGRLRDEGIIIAEIDVLER